MRNQPLRQPNIEPNGINTYRCNACAGVMVTVDLDPGTTPAFLGCRLTPTCRGSAASSWYTPIEKWPDIMTGFRVLYGEWYRPRLSELRKLAIMARRNDAARAVLDHLQRGGLVLRAPTAHGLARAAKLSGDAWEPGHLFSRPNDELLPGRGGTA